MSRILSFAAFLVVATNAIKLELTQSLDAFAPVEVIAPLDDDAVAPTANVLGSPTPLLAPIPEPVFEAIETMEGGWAPSLTSFDPEFDLNANDLLVSTQPDDGDCGCNHSCHSNSCCDDDKKEVDVDSYENIQAVAETADHEAMEAAVEIAVKENLSPEEAADLKVHLEEAALEKLEDTVVPSAEEQATDEAIEHITEAVTA